MSLIKQQLENSLQILQPQYLAIEDESHRHAGHAGNNGGAHFKVMVCSAQFTGKTRLERQRMVYKAVAHLMPHPIHALALQTAAPDEFSLPVSP